MRNKIYSLIAMLTMALALTSCFSENEKKQDRTKLQLLPSRLKK